MYIYVLIFKLHLIVSLSYNTNPYFAIIIIIYSSHFTSIVSYLQLFNNSDISLSTFPIISPYFMHVGQNSYIYILSSHAYYTYLYLVIFTLWYLRRYIAKFTHILSYLN